MYFFGLVICLMWAFVLFGFCKKMKYRKREKWVRAFKKLSEGNAYADAYEDLIDLAFSFKGTAYELIENSSLPENEKIIAVNYFKYYVYKDTSSMYGSNKIVNYVIWFVSIILVLVIYFSNFHGMINFEEDLFIVVFLLSIINFAIQILLHFLFLLGKSVIKKIASAEGGENAENTEKTLSECSKNSKISFLRELFEKILF